MLRASPMSQVANTRILWLMGLEQCIAGCDVAREDLPCVLCGKDLFSQPQRTQGFTEGTSMLFFGILSSRLLFASFRPLRHGRRLRMMTHVGPENPEDDVLGNVSSVVRDA